MYNSTKSLLCKTNEFSMLDVDSKEKIIQVLEKGGLILFPTDTIWGIGCDATNEQAVEKIYQLKQRNKDKPLIVLVHNVEMLKQYVEHVHPKIETLLSFHTRPLTVIYEKGMNLAENVMSNDGSIGIRVILDPFCQGLIKAFGKPIVATSANVSDRPFPRNFGEISSDILQGVDFVTRIRQTEKNLNEPSVIVKMDDNGELFFIRE